MTTDASKEQQPTAALVSRACPSFFQAACRIARRDRSRSGGYYVAGYMFAGHIEQLEPLDTDCTEDEWLEAVEQLTDALYDLRFDDAAEWMRRHLPKCAALVPSKRMPRFLEGLEAGYANDRDWAERGRRKE